ncbi:Lsr2 protein [Williamsia limnetica]|uniref:Lsr2 protein n=1 Tax=Williamsia limnetica TaxID=882452 RepID=A0A318RGQ7_WILLI|nr:Lsr2 family protein [Williamsia limnetica]PYE13554.1 Lsr2 protein [Williamsia limnetica]
MATVTRLEFTDDLDGKALDVDDINTVSWSWLGVDYEFDTSTTNLDRIETGRVPISTLLAKSRRVGGRKRSPGHKKTGNSSIAASDSNAPADTKTVRAWAQEQGYELSSRGRIPTDIIEAYTQQN